MAYKQKFISHGTGEAGNSNIQVPEDWVITTLIPVMAAPSLAHNRLPEASPLIPSLEGWDFNIWIWWEDASIQFIASWETDISLLG